jgi:hypothetical protein
MQWRFKQFGDPLPRVTRSNATPASVPRYKIQAIISAYLGGQRIKESIPTSSENVYAGKRTRDEKRRETSAVKCPMIDSIT